MRRTHLVALFISASFFCFPLSHAYAETKVAPSLPFEKYFQKKNGRKDTLRFNDFSGKIKPERIQKLLRSGAILGDRVLLQNDTSVYFPDGYIVSTTARFDRWRVKKDVKTASLGAPKASMLEPNPDYGVLKNAEQFLGKTCAKTHEYGPNSSIKIRKRPDGVLSLVKRVKGRFGDIKGTSDPSVVIISALDPKYLSEDGRIRALASKCLL